MRRLIAGAAVAASSIFPMSASAATAVWAGDVAGSVDDETKWVNGYKPQAGDTLDFSAVTATGMASLSAYRAINGPSNEVHFTTLTGLDHVYLGGTSGDYTHPIPAGADTFARLFVKNVKDRGLEVAALFS